MADSEHFDGLLAAHPELSPLLTPIKAALDLLAGCARSGGTIYTCGNGGSAADAEHIVGELMKGFLLPRSLPPADREALIRADADRGPVLADHLQGGVRAVSLVSGVALPTAFANDARPELVFAQQIFTLSRPGDVLWGISTSGRSGNVNYALAAARARGVSTLGLTGRDGGPMAGLCDIELRVPSDHTPRIQELHLPVYHTLCAALEAELF